MALFDVFVFILFSFLLLPLQPSTSVEICRVFCGGQWIRFPFSLSDEADRCGYPRFNLSCRNQALTVITLPFAGEFRVEIIDYWVQSIWINDPDYCTPRRFLKGLNLSHTPFEPVHPQNYTFLNCSAGVSTQLPEARYIDCLSAETFSVVVIPTNVLDSYASLVSSSCLKIATVLVPSWDPNYGMRLTWNEPDCKFCERSGGACMFKSDTGLDVKCYGGFSPGLPESAKYGLAFGLGIPLLCIAGLVFYLRRKVNDYNHHQHPSPEISIPVAPRRLTTEPKGLDGPAIEAHPTTLLGESGELPRPNDNTCPICLCEYQAKEMIRTIPDCKHYFHASCIDEWLKLNATCPVCRNTTERSAPSASSSSSSSSSH
ncbi:putative RING-H2 finger protein ATL21B [Herrania umbratica]|uniref:RING-type E3 ubiquitin transferase n=1 Tax=Herrania umbratica TaxID=108875 RepID=A0A6J1AQ56_9ROSI|nr:putative RING-H2 finger protein ATL21B [Herrania umbratica]